MWSLATTSSQIDIFKEEFLPTQVDEINPWAIKRWLINTYFKGWIEHILTLDDLGQAQKKRIQSLIANSDDRDHELAKKFQIVVKELGSKIQDRQIYKTFLEVLITSNKLSSLYTLPLSQLDTQLIWYQEDWATQSLRISRAAWSMINTHIQVPNNPLEVYNHCIWIQNFDIVECKLIQAALDQAPYRDNYRLLSEYPFIEIKYDRDQYLIEFIASQWEDYFEGNRVYSFSDIVWISDMDDKEYGIFDKLSVIEKKDWIEKNSDRYKSFQPDFLDK